MKTLRVNRARIPLTYGEMLTAVAAVLALAGVLYAVLTVAGCGSTLPPPADALPAGRLARLYCVDEPACSVYRSAQPSAEDFRVLAARYHIKSVLKLNYEIEGRDEIPPGVELIYAPIDVLADVSHEQLVSVCRALRDAPKPALVHCTHGEDRTGLIVGLCVRLRLGDAPPSLPSTEAVWREMVTFGFHDGVVNTPGLPELVKAFRREAGR